MNDIVDSFVTNHICPYCGSDYVIVDCAIKTAAYYPPIYKDGVNINPDRNSITTHYTCLACGKDFSF